MTYAVRDGWIDRVLRDVAFDAQIVVRAPVTRQRATLLLHLVRGLPCARDHFADAAHRLRIAAYHADGAEVMKNVFGRNRLAANPALRERHVLRQIGVEMMTHH